MAQKVFCDKCKKEIIEQPGAILLSQDLKVKDYNLCVNCYKTLLRVLAEYLP